MAFVAKITWKICLWSKFFLLIPDSVNRSMQRDTSVEQHQVRSMCRIHISHINTLQNSSSNKVAYYLQHAGYDIIGYSWSPNHGKMLHLHDRIHHSNCFSMFWKTPDLQLKLLPAKERGKLKGCLGDTGIINRTKTSGRSSGREPLHLQNKGCIPGTWTQIHKRAIQISRLWSQCWAGSLHRTTNSIPSLKKSKVKSISSCRSPL